MQGVYVYPGKKLTTKEGNAELGLSKTSDFVHGSNVYEVDGDIICKLIVYLIIIKHTFSLSSWFGINQKHTFRKSRN